MTSKTFYLNSTFQEKATGKKSSGLRIAGYANTTAKDRAGDVVTAEAWTKGVENFRNNPIMLYQHKHDCPIGRFDKISVDKKGIYVEGVVSEAAEKNYGIHTLIKDGSLKSFSVGFRIKDAKYDKLDDSTTITDVELLEISVVSVPCNQDSLFSVRKSFDSETDYKSFIKQLSVDDSDEEINTESENIDIMKDDITDSLKITASEEDFIDDIVLNNSTDSSILNSMSTEKLNTLIQESVQQALKEINKKPKELEEIEEDDDIVDTSEPIEFVNFLSVNPKSIEPGDYVYFENNNYKVLEVPNDQNPIFKFLKFDVTDDSCNNTINVSLKELSNQKTNEIEIDSEDLASDDNLDKSLHEHSTKENNTMAEQVVDSIDLTEANSVSEAKTKAEPAKVSEPEVAKLVEKTGEAIIKEADAKDKYGEYTPVESDEVAEMKSLIDKYKAEIKSLNESKMTYNENKRSSQFSEKEMANAVLLANMLNRKDVFDTKLGTRMKAVTTVDQFLSNFSKNIYHEMEQQLIIAPMFTRLPVDAKKFEVPVADEDTDGDVAMFKSGTYATGIADNTNVPTSNQHTLSSVEFTPHKFMATTHLAKDEQEDTVLPLLDFLRAATTRRLARAIDKSILRGTGALTGFTASPTNTITAGTGYASVIEGITNLTADASLEVSTGSSSDKVDPSDIAAARTLMGKYGLQLGNDLVFLTSIEGYNNLVTTSDFRTVDKFGPNATYLTGSVGAVYGIPIAITEFLDGVGSSGNHLGVLLYKPGFMVAERRGIEIESEYDPRRQVTAMYLSTRFDFKALTTNSNAALDANKYAFATTITAG